MNEDLFLKYNQDDIMDASAKIYDRFNIPSTTMLNINFVPNILSNVCSMEIEELKDVYISYEGIALVIVTCNSQDEIDQWKVDNDIPNFWYVFSDFDRYICKKFSALVEEFDIPTRLTCLVENGIMKWIYETSIQEKRDMAHSNLLNAEMFQTNLKKTQD
jgi:alkyl hydroperoxide reductase subunit AhpC